MSKQKQRYLLSFFILFVFSCQDSIKENDNESKPIKLFFGGDILLDRGVKIEIEKNGIVSLFQ